MSLSVIVAAVMNKVKRVKFQESNFALLVKKFCLSKQVI